MRVPPDGDELGGPRRPRTEGGLHLRVFRLLLRLYPRPFVRDYGEEMAELFRWRLARARSKGGRRGVAAEWLHTLADVVRTAVAERMEGFGAARHGRMGSGRARVGRIGAGRAATATSTSRLDTGGAMDLESMGQDVRHATRRLVRTPVFTATAVAILALGIGANTAAFSVVDALLFRPPPFERPEEVVRIYQDSDDGRPSSTSFPAYRDMAAMDGVFAGVAAESPGGATWETEDGARPVQVAYTTSSLLPVLGLDPFRGRWFSPEHDEVGADAVAVVSHRTWRGKLGSDPGVIGRTIRLNGEPVTVIGVGPEEYSGDAGALALDFWLSISATPVGGPFRVANLERRQDHWYQVTARLAPGVGLPRARAAMDALAARLADAFPDLNRDRAITVFAHEEVRFHPEVDASLRAAGFGLLAVVGLVLLLACGNLSNLLLVRGVSRAPETAVRKALGAGTGRIARLFLAETLLLSLLGSAVGIALAAWLVTLVPALPLPLGGLDLDVALDRRVLAFGAGLALATGALFGVAPAVRSARTDVASAIREGSAGGSAARGVTLLRNGLVMVQVAISVVLVVGAGLLVRSLDATRSVDPGVDVDRVAFAGTDLTRGGVTAEERPAVLDEILRRVEALPGVERAGLTSRLPVQNGPTSTTVLEGYEPPSGTGAVEIPVGLADAGYFEAMGIPLLEGRIFGPDDGPESPIVVVVNRTAADRFWGGDAVGRRVRPQDAPEAWRRVIGVVDDVKVTDLQEAPTPQFIYAIGQYDPTSATLVARTGGDPAALLPAMREEIRGVRSSLPMTRLGTLEAHLGDALVAPRAVTVFVGAFSLLALLLATMGIYGVVSFTVTRRTSEMGIRIALGAARKRLVAMVVGQSLAVVAVGVVAGVGLALLAVPGLEGMLFGVEALDPVTFAGSALLLLVVAALASWLPARKASLTDPVDALRAE